jgi:hypothetical protein
MVRKTDKKINPQADRKVFLTAWYRNICALSIDFMLNTHKNKPESVYYGPQVGNHNSPSGNNPTHPPLKLRGGRVGLRGEEAPCLPAGRQGAWGRYSQEGGGLICAERFGIIRLLMRENTLCLYSKKNGFWMIFLFIISQFIIHLEKF